MAKVFDFYQFSSGFIGSGLVSNYPSLFSGKFAPDGSYTGIFTPEGLYNTPKAYLFGVEDNVFTPANLTVYPSGDVSSSNLYIVSTDNKISGEFFPVISESGAISCIYSGRLSGDNIDINNYSAIPSGEVTNFGIDTPLYLLVFTGQVISPFGDTNLITNIISGEVTPQFFDNPNTNLILSGNVVKYERDKPILQFNIESISWTKGSLKVTDVENDKSNITFSVEYIGWSQLN